jgi:hypothetical protein
MVRISMGSPDGGAINPAIAKLKLLDTLDENSLDMLIIFVARLPEQLSEFCTF